MKLLPLVLRGIIRTPIRAGLTLAGVAVAVFLFTGVISLERGMSRMLGISAGENVLVVAEKYQGCPVQSKLPAAHGDAIAELPAVAAVTRTLFVMSACSRATDLVAVHGIEPGNYRDFRDLRISDAEYAAFSGEKGAAIVGAVVAQRYGWQVGQAVTLQELGGISFTIRGIFEAPGNSLENAILVDLEYLQLATSQPGVVTLLLVQPKEDAEAGALAAEIDALFDASRAPSKTSPEHAFIASAVSGITGLVDFSRWLGFASLGLIVVGVGNSMSMSIRDRTREIALLKIAGFRRAQVLRVILAEAVASALIGGLLGAWLAAWAVSRSAFSISVEGYTIVPHVSIELILLSTLLAALMGLVGSYLPARAASRLTVPHALREVD